MAYAETLNQSLIALGAAIFEVLQQLSTPGHHRQQTSPRMVILFVGFEMLSQLQNALTQQSDLHFWRTRIRFMNPILRDHLGFLFCRQSHA